jgi:hypothetical protein
MPFFLKASIPYFLTCAIPYSPEACYASLEDLILIVHAEDWQGKSQRATMTFRCRPGRENMTYDKIRQKEFDMEKTEQAQSQLAGLLLVEARQDEENIVDIYSIQGSEMILIESGGETFARTWLCKHARRLVAWRPRLLHDELSGIWSRLNIC